MAKRLLLETDKRLLWKLAWNFGFKGMLSVERAKRMRQLGNVTPLISVEGNEIVSDERRGRPGVFNKTMVGLRNCLNHKVFTGVCTSLARTNIDDLLTEAWVDRLIEMGVMYTW